MMIFNSLYSFYFKKNKSSYLKRVLKLIKISFVKKTEYVIKLIESLNYILFIESYLSRNSSR